MKNLKRMEMEHLPNTDFSTRAGVLGGVVFVVLVQWDEVVKTTLLAAIGAVVSFGVSMGMKWLVRRCLETRGRKAAEGRRRKV